MPDPIIQAIASSSEFKIPPIAGEATTTDAPGSVKSFGTELGNALENLAKMQQNADTQSQALALGKTNDVAGVVMGVERANLAMQLATQVRNKAVDAYHEIFRMQI
jgi:flagellar hook-basal body complex protein FliE